MGTNSTYQGEYDEVLHPLWLGILLLFTVITTIGIVCLLRKKYGSQLYYLYHRLCCKNGINNENHSKPKAYFPIYRSHKWGPSYNPASSITPRIYTIVRNIRMTSLDKDSSSVKGSSFNKDSLSIKDSSLNKDDIENCLSEIAESATARTTRSQSNVGEESNKTRNCEAARKFYASMRYNSQCRNTTSFEDPNVHPSPLPNGRSKTLNRDDSLEFFRAPHFFQSITDTRSKV